MKMYEDFLESVRDANPDEFTELGDILMRHQELTKRKGELESKQ